MNIIRYLDSIEIPNCIRIGFKEALFYKELEERREFYRGIPEVEASLKKAVLYNDDIVSRFPKGDKARSNI